MRAFLECGQELEYPEKNMQIPQRNAQVRVWNNKIYLLRDNSANHKATILLKVYQTFSLLSNYRQRKFMQTCIPNVKEYMVPEATTWYCEES